MELQFWIDHADSFFHQIFMIIMGGLIGIANLFGTTYNVVNIVVYFLLIPISWIYLISRKTNIKLNLISLGLVLIFIILPNKIEFCDNLFQKSVDFLYWSADIFNSSYINMSVYICVIFIGIVYLVLIPITLSKKVSRIILISVVALSIIYLILIYPNFKKIMLVLLQKAGINH
jgi:hypothetical protein